MMSQGQLVSPALIGKPVNTTWTHLQSSGKINYVFGLWEETWVDLKKQYQCTKHTDLRLRHSSDCVCWSECLCGGTLARASSRAREKQWLAATCVLHQAFVKQGLRYSVCSVRAEGGFGSDTDSNANKQMQCV